MSPRASDIAAILMGVLSALLLFFMLNIHVVAILVPLMIIDAVVMSFSNSSVGGIFHFRRRKEDSHPHGMDTRTWDRCSTGSRSDYPHYRSNDFHYDDTDVPSWEDRSASCEDEPPRRRRNDFHHDYVHMQTRDGYGVGDAWITPDPADPNHAFAELYDGDRRIMASL